MNFELLFDKSIQATLKNKELIKQIQDNPEMILTELFKGKGCYNFITKTIEAFGDGYTIHDFQKYLYGLLIPVLQKKLGDEYEFTFNSNHYSASINIEYQGYKLVYVSIYNETVSTAHPLFIDSHEKNLIATQEIIDNKSKLLQRFEDAGMNPFKLCKTPFDFIYFIFEYNSFKKRREEIMTQLKKGIESFTKDMNCTKKRIDEETAIRGEIDKRTAHLVAFFEQYGYDCYS